jgi:hypothetical protein
MAVRTPTSDIMPIATIKAVRTERSILARIERSPSLMFSINSIL